METPPEREAFLIFGRALRRSKRRTRILVQPKEEHADGTKDCGRRADCRARCGRLWHLEAGTYSDGFGEEEGGRSAGRAGGSDPAEDRANAGAASRHA